VIARLIICETTAAITLHLRELEEGEEPCYSGRKGEKRTLCGMMVGWDTKIPIDQVGCGSCIKETDVE